MLTVEQQLRLQDLEEITGYGWNPDANPTLVEEFNFLHLIQKNGFEIMKKIDEEKKLAEEMERKSEIRFRGTDLEKIWKNTPNNFSKSDKIYYIKFDDSFHASNFEVIFSEKRGKFAFENLSTEIKKANARSVSLWSMSRNAD